MKLILLLLVLASVRALTGCSNATKEELAMTETAYGACKDAFSEAQKTIRLQDEKIKLLEEKVVHTVDFYESVIRINEQKSKKQ